METTEMAVISAPQDAVTSQGAARCSAHSKTAGKRCRQPAIMGATVCRYHGGGAPQVRAKARQRLIELACGPAITTLNDAVKRARKTGEVPNAQEIRAAELLLKIAGLDTPESVNAAISAVGETKGGTYHEFMMIFERRLKQSSDAQD